MYSETDLLPISALQHIVFCERQCALIHIERQWEENRLTAEGKILHDKTDKEEVESRGNLRIARALLLQNKRLGLFGRADVVEFHLVSDGLGVSLPGVDGKWQPYPVEYKRGKPKADRCDEVQLCAQALCLEEMLSTTIAEGALFYGTPRRRTVITFDNNLRNETEIVAERLQKLINCRITPKAAYEKKCDNCSLIDICLPQLDKKTTAKTYVDTILDSFDKECDETTA
jgi:CRISPR-associated exonuclease Cas4